jgi:hypothetical protein
MLQKLGPIYQLVLESYPAKIYDGRKYIIKLYHQLDNKYIIKSCFSNCEWFHRGPIFCFAPGLFFSGTALPPSIFDVTITEEQVVHLL